MHVCTTAGKVRFGITCGQDTTDRVWAVAQSNSGVLLYTNLGDLPLPNALPYLQRTDIGPLQTAAGQSNIDITGRPIAHNAHCSVAYSALACLRIGMSESASFQSVRKSW
jgi:hypothetical protein